MRAMRMFTAAVASLVLVAACSGVVAAEDEADPTAPAYFTFDEPVVEPSMDDEAQDSEGFTREVRGATEVSHIEATDPRASGRMTTLGNMNMLEFDDGGGLATWAGQVRLVNEGGAWSGSTEGRMFVVEGGGATSVATLSGEDGYEGLTLVMVEYYDDDTTTRRGVIIPSDQMPPMPEPPTE